MVAAGGCGVDCAPGGDGGKLEGQYADNYGATTLPGPGTQTSGGNAGSSSSLGIAYPGEFGIGGSGDCFNKECDGGGSGGGGYYGGGGITLNGGGSGGSSFISGYDGCKAIDKNTLKPTQSSIHYSQHVFASGRMFAGNEEMPSSTSSGTSIGNTGNGFARITILQVYQTCHRRNNVILPAVIFAIIIVTT